MNAPWDTIVPQGHHFQLNTSVHLEHGATRLDLSELNNVQSALLGKNDLQYVLKKD